MFRHTNIVCLGRGFQKRVDPIFAVNPYDILSNETLSIVLETELRDEFKETNIDEKLDEQSYDNT